MTVLNLHATAVGLLNRNTTTGNSENYEIIKAVQHAGYTKGYANFWQGNINTYLTNSRIHFLPAWCTDDVSLKFRWLINDADFTTKATKSFYLIDPTIPAAPSCSIEAVTEQFGAPTKVIPLNSGKQTLLLFNYDVTSKMPYVTPNQK
jgi:hypothetical protein